MEGALRLEQHVALIEHITKVAQKRFSVASNVLKEGLLGGIAVRLEGERPVVPDGHSCHLEANEKVLRCCTDVHSLELADVVDDAYSRKNRDHHALPVVHLEILDACDNVRRGVCVPEGEEDHNLYCEELWNRLERVELLFSCHVKQYEVC